MKANNTLHRWHERIRNTWLGQAGGQPLVQQAAHSDRQAAYGQAGSALQGHISRHLHPHVKATCQGACLMPQSILLGSSATCRRVDSGPAEQLLPCLGSKGHEIDPGGGRGEWFTQVHEIVASLQAKIISSLLKPERLVWKDFAPLHFGHSQQ